MSYIGAEPTTAAFPFDQFSGTGSATAFTLSQAPAGNTSVIVYVGGAVQNPNTYTIVGTTITFSVAPVAGTNNIGVLLLGLPALVGVPNVGTVTPAMLSTGGPVWDTLGDLTVSANSTTNALRITQTGTGNALVVEDSTNPDSSPFVIDASGRLIVGHTANTVPAGTNPFLQIQSTVGTQSAILGWSTTSAASPVQSFYRSASGIVGTYGTVASGFDLGKLSFFGDDGTAFIEAASILTEVDGTPGTNDMPGRLVFSTTADGASSPTERMRITNAGNVGVGKTPTTALDVNGTVTATTFSGAGTSLTGTAASLTIGGSAATLTTGRTIALTGDVTYTSPAFNGSANVTAAATLANSGVTAGTYGSASVIPSVTVDAKGRVTSITTNAVAGGVTSVNGQTGAVVTTDLFSIGSTVTGRPANVTTYAVNATIAGTSLYSTTPTEAYSGGFTVATATLINTGTWRCMSIAPNGPGSAGYAGVWARIS